MMAFVIIVLFGLGFNKLLSYEEKKWKKQSDYTAESINIGDKFHVTFDNGNPFETETYNVTVIDKKMGTFGTWFIKYEHEDGSVGTEDVMRFMETYEREKK
jgi:hypothetical protein